MNVTSPHKNKLRDRRSELVQAALMLSAKQAPADVTTADLAQVVGITQGAIFRHFEYKEAIWIAVLDWAHDTLLPLLENAAKPHLDVGSPVPALRAMFLAHIGFVQQFPGVPRLVFQELQHPGPTRLKKCAQSLMEDYRKILIRCLEQAQASGTIGPWVDTHAASTLVMGAVQGLVLQSLMTADLKSMQQRASRILDVLEVGLTGLPPKDKDLS
jgi:TetR/AcrR family transcriptional regulator